MSIYPPKIFVFIYFNLVYRFIVKIIIIIIIIIIVK